MGRITHRGETSAKKRHAHLRSCAEVLRLLAVHPAVSQGIFDAEARDMTAFLVINLRGVYESIDKSAAAWDERDYWKKAEALREKWRWSRTAADELEALILADRWLQVPPLLIDLLPHLQSVTITSLTRDADWWCGAYRALQRRSAT
jgi:hypothetical protein